MARAACPQRVRSRENPRSCRGQGPRVGNDDRADQPCLSRMDGRGDRCPRAARVWPAARGARTRRGRLGARARQAEDVGSGGRMRPGRPRGGRSRRRRYRLVGARGGARGYVALGPGVRASRAERVSAPAAGLARAGVALAGRPQAGGERPLPREPRPSCSKPIPSSRNPACHQEPRARLEGGWRNARTSASCSWGPGSGSMVISMGEA